MDIAGAIESIAIGEIYIAYFQEIYVCIEFDGHRVVYRISRIANRISLIWYITAVIAMGDTRWAIC